MPHMYVVIREKKEYESPAVFFVEDYTRLNGMLENGVLNEKDQVIKIESIQIVEKRCPLHLVDHTEELVRQE